MTDHGRGKQRRIDYAAADAAAAESRAERAALIRTVERATEAIGIPTASAIGRIAALIARVAGTGVLVRTAAEIQADPTVDCSSRHVRRAIDDLRECEIIHVDLIDASASTVTRRRGRGAIAKRYALSIDWAACRAVVAAAERDFAAAIEAVEMPRPITGRDPDATRTRPGPGPDAGRTRAGREPDVSRTSSDLVFISSPHPIPSPVPRSPSPAAADANTVAGDRDRRVEGGGGGTVDQKLSDGAVDRPAPTTPPRTVTRDAIEQRAGLIADAIGGRENADWQTVWRISAARSVGVLSQHDVADAVAAVQSIRPRDPIGYLRSTIASNSGIGRDGLTRALAAIKCVGGYPTERPRRRTRAGPAVTPRRPPEADRRTNEQLAAAMVATVGPFKPER